MSFKKQSYCSCKKKSFSNNFLGSLFDSVFSNYDYNQINKTIIIKSCDL